MPSRNPERRQRILELRLAGKSLKEIAAAVGISRTLASQYVRGMLRRGEVPFYSKEQTRKNQAEGHKKRKTFNNAKRQEELWPAIEMRKKGMTLEQIGEKLDSNPNTISLFLESCGFVGRRGKPTPLQKTLIALRLEGLTYQEIADRTGKPRGTVGVILTRLIKKGLVPSDADLKRLRG